MDNPEQGAQKALEIIEEQLNANNLHVLGLATGSTMIPIYKKWVESDLSFDNVTTFNLDEYVGLDAENKNSYTFFMNDHLFSKKNFKRSYLPNGVAENLEEECARYEQLLTENPLDIQFLGIGVNGHIAFSEPGTPFDSKTHVANLASSTLGENNKYFDDNETIPDKALTMGVASILPANKIILVVFGEHKRFALEKLMEGKITTDYPVTALLNHNDVTVITDVKNLA